MRLLFISESFPTSSKVDLTGGAETRDWYVATALAKRHDVTVVTAARLNAPHKETMKRVKVIRLGISVLPENRESATVRLNFFGACRRVIPRMNFDLIQGSNVFTQFIAAAITSSLHRPNIALISDVHLDSWLQNTNLITGLASECIERWTLKQPWDKIISWSEATTQKLVNHHVDPQLISTIPGGVDIQLISHQTTPKRKNPTIITVARLVLDKRIDALIKAVPVLAKKHPQLKLYILGDGPDRNRLEKLTVKLNIDNHVVFMGQVDSYAKVIRLIKSAHIFSLPSEVEGFSLATLEACACGLPYVNVDIPAIFELTQGGKGGFLLPKADPKLLAATLDELLEDKKLYNTKVRESLALARQHDWSLCVRKTEKIFKEIINQKPAGCRCC